MVRRTREEDVAKGPNRMTQVTIENPIINSPYDEPSRHFRFSDEGITNEVEAGRRRSRSNFRDAARPCPDRPAPEGFLARF
jgi:hypothetical protein